MSQKKIGKTQSASSKLVNARTGKVGKTVGGIVGGIAVLAALVNNLKTIEPIAERILPQIIALPTPVSNPIAGALSKATSPEQCYQLELQSPHIVSISAAKSGNFSWFRLLFENHCPDVFFIRVEFKPLSDGIGIGNDPDRWPSYTIQAGQKLDRPVNPPSIDLLTEKPRVIQILCSIYKKDNQQLLYQDTSLIQISSDNGPAAPGGLTRGASTSEARSVENTVGKSTESPIAAPDPTKDAFLFFARGFRAVRQNLVDLTMRHLLFFH